MKRLLVAAVACFAGTPAALAAETDFSSPYDKNPHCAERTTSAMAPECLIQDEGTPRQTYPPAARPGPPNQPPQNPPTPGPPAVTPPAATLPGQTSQPGIADTPGGTPPASGGTAGTTGSATGSSAGTAGASSATQGSAVGTQGGANASGAMSGRPSTGNTSPGAARSSTR
jgi:hypothetical protein